MEDIIRIPEEGERPGPLSAPPGAEREKPEPAGREKCPPVPPPHENPLHPGPGKPPVPPPVPPCVDGPAHPEPGDSPAFPPSPHGPQGPYLDPQRYEKLDTEGKLFAMIQALGHASRFYLDERGGQNRVLSVLPEEGSMSQKEITRRLCIHPASTGEILRKLEHAGLVRREAGELDRRTFQVSLTPAGLARRRAQAEQNRDEHRGLFAALTEEEKATLLSLLETLHADWCRLKPEIAGPAHHPPGRPGDRVPPEQLYRKPGPAGHPPVPEEEKERF